MTFDDHILWAFLDIASEEGSAEITDALEDGWTILSKNGDWSAQWEHTVLVTEHGAEILTSCWDAQSWKKCPGWNWRFAAWRWDTMRI